MRGVILLKKQTQPTWLSTETQDEEENVLKSQEELEKMTKRWGRGHGKDEAPGTFGIPEVD